MKSIVFTSLLAFGLMGCQSTTVNEPAKSPSPIQEPVAQKVAPAAPSIPPAKNELDSKLDEFSRRFNDGGASLDSLFSQAGDHRVGNTWFLILTAKDVWHSQDKQLRLEAAQALWKVWADVASPDSPDKAFIKIVDQMGNEVGGSRIWGGSLIWVQD